MSSEENRQQILALIKSISTGISNDDLIKELPNVTPAICVDGLNKLLQQGLIDLLKCEDKLFYRAKETQPNALIQTADTDEKIVYNVIEKGGNKGIWIRDIRLQTNLNMTQLNKLLKSLETKKLIKAVKSVNASKKKVYMLYNLEPDRSITGGAWYQDQDFESEFVDVLNQQCLRYLQTKRENAEKSGESPLVIKQLTCCTVKEVHAYISKLGISKVTLDPDDLETILKTVVYDGKAERILMNDGSYIYRAVNTPMSPPGIVKVPCGICPLVNACAEIGHVTPIKCVYMQEWID